MSGEYGVTSYSSQTTTTTAALTVPTGGYAAGDAVIIFGSQNPTGTNGPVSCADTRGNSWTTYKGGDNLVEPFFCVALLTTALLAGDTVTVTMVSGARQFLVMFGRSGVSSLTMDGAVQFHSGAQTAATTILSPTTGALTLTQEQTYAGFSAAATNSVSSSFTPEPSWDAIATSAPAFASNNRAVFVEGRRNYDTLAIQAFATQATSLAYYGAILTLRDVSGSGGTITPTGVTHKVLGQSNPGANTDTTLYTVPANRQAVCSTLVVCNQAATAATFRAAARIAGAALAAPQYLFYDVSVAANTSLTITIGITLGAADVVTVRASSANVSFGLFGQEITP